MQNQSAKNAPLDMNKWREIVEAWNKSGENQKTYCERLGISLNTFSYVRSKLLQQNKSHTQFIPLTIKNNEEEIKDFILPEKQAVRLSQAKPLLDDLQQYLMSNQSHIPPKELVRTSCQLHIKPMAKNHKLFKRPAT